MATITGQTVITLDIIEISFPNLFHHKISFHNKHLLCILVCNLVVVKFVAKTTNWPILVIIGKIWLTGYNQQGMSRYGNGSGNFGQTSGYGVTPGYGNNIGNGSSARYGIPSVNPTQAMFVLPESMGYYGNSYALLTAPTPCYSS